MLRSEYGGSVAGLLGSDQAQGSGIDCVHGFGWDVSGYPWYAQCCADPEWSTWIFRHLVGGGGAAAINQLLDAKIDAQMARTSWRPLVVGKVRPVQVLVFAGVLITLSMTILTIWVNLITAVLTFTSLIGYAVIYTVYLKRMTSQNIVIGGLAGAMPPMLGWAAVTGLSTAADWINASLLVAIIFVWTPPHFWALAIFRRADYAKASIPMLPVTHGVQHTSRQILLYTVILSVVTLLPVATGMSGVFYLGAALVLDAVFLWYAWRLLDPPDELFAMKTFGYSIVYLMALFAFLMFDHWLRLADFYWN